MNNSDKIKYDKLTMEVVNKVLTEMSQEAKNDFNREIQENVKAKFPDYKEEVNEAPVILPLEQNEGIEERRVNNIKAKGQNPYATHPLVYFDGVSKHKSVWRAMRRGHTSVVGEEFPKKPFNNRKNKKVNEVKKEIYGEYKKVLNRA